MQQEHVVDGQMVSDNCTLSEDIKLQHLAALNIWKSSGEYNAKPLPSFVSRVHNVLNCYRDEVVTMNNEPEQNERTFKDGVFAPIISNIRQLSGQSCGLPYVDLGIRNKCTCDEDSKTNHVENIPVSTFLAGANDCCSTCLEGEGLRIKNHIKAETLSPSISSVCEQSHTEVPIPETTCDPKTMKNVCVVKRLYFSNDDMNEEVCNVIFVVLFFITKSLLKFSCRIAVERSCKN